MTNKATKGEGAAHASVSAIEPSSSPSVCHTGTTSTFFTLFRWEVRALHRDPAFWLMLVFSCAALGFALANGLRWQRELKATLVSAERADRDAQASARAFAANPDPNVSPFRDPRTPSGYANGVMAHFAVLPPTPLAVLTVGQSDLLPSALPLAPGANPALASGASVENPHRLLIGRFDAAFAVVFLGPLLIIGLTHALLAGERERGTLALLLAQPVTARALVTARLAPRVLTCLGLLTVFITAFALMTESSSAFLRPALWIIVALAYGAFWFALCVVVASRRGGAATQTLIVAAIWLGFVVLVPAVINLAVKMLHPVPSRMEMVLAMRAATDRTTNERSKVLAAFYEDHPELASKSQSGAPTIDEAQAVRLASAEKIERDLAPVLARFDAQLGRQQALVGKLQFFSPALLAHAALVDATGTGPVRHRYFLSQATAHHAELRNFFNPRILRKEKFDAWEQVPPFRFIEESDRVVAQRVAPAVAALFAVTLALGALGWRMLRTYSVHA